MVKKEVTIPMPKLTGNEREVWRILNFIKTYYTDHLWEKWVSAYKNYFMYKIDREMTIKSFQTNVKSPVTKMYVDAMWTGIYDNVINFRVIWRDKEDQKKAGIVKNFLEWWFSISDSRKELMSAVKEALICWPAYLKVGFVNREKKIKYRKDFKTKENIIKEQYPYIKYVSIFNLFHDPAVENFSESPRVVERKVISEESVRKYYSWLIPGVDQKMENAKAFPMYFSTYDYNKIKQILFWNKDIVSRYIKDNQSDLDTFMRNYLSINYVGNYIEVIEYWTDDKLIILFNGREAYCWPTQLPINKKPYTSIQYNKAPGLAFGNGVGTSIEDIQNLTDELLNLQMDNTKFQIAPMYQKVKGADIFSTSKKWLEYVPFDIVETNTPNAIQRLDLGSPDFTWINTIQFLLQLWEMSEWVNSYTMGYQNKVERSATWVSALVQAFKSRLLPLVESMNSALADIAEMWIATALVLMDKNISLRVLEWQDGVTFNEISIEDLVGKYDIEFDAQALKSATREVKRSQLAELIPLALQAWFNPNTQEYFIDMRKLWKEIFDAYEMPQELVLEPKEVVREVTKYQREQQKAQQKMQWETYQQQGQPTQGIWLDVSQLQWGVEWDTRTWDLRSSVPAAVTQEIQQEEMWPEMWAILKSAAQF